MIRFIAVLLGLVAAMTGAARPAQAETVEEWIAVGTRVHGGFGAFIPVGIRIGLEALTSLNAKPREVTVLYHDSDKAPCACIADGVAIATLASVGQRTLEISSVKAPAGAMAVIIVTKKQSSEGIRFTVPEGLLPKLAEWNRTFDPRGRYEAVMKAEGLFSVTPLR